MGKQAQMLQKIKKFEKQLIQGAEQIDKAKQQKIALRKQQQMKEEKMLKAKREKERLAEIEAKQGIVIKQHDDKKKQL